jgi:hypothetical protein
MNGRRASLAALALATLVLSACASVGTGESGAPGMAPMPPTDAMVDRSKSDIASNVGGGPASEGVPVAAIDRDLILTANVQMKSDDPWQTADAARAIATGLGGSLLNMSQSISNERRTANVVMRVPADQFDNAIAQLKKLDVEVLSSSADSKDVTDQLVDLDARLTALRAEETRYLQLFASAKTVDEMLKVQVALSQLRQQIESLAAAQKNTKDRVAFSTISLNVVSTAEPIVGTGKWDPSRTFAAALAAVTALFRFIADFAIWALVFSWIPLLALAAVVFATRVRRAPAA